MRHFSLKRSSFLSTLLAATAIAVCSNSALAQSRASDNFPSRPGVIVVPVQPGSSSDAGARLWAQVLSEALGKPFVLDFKPGGGGVIGMNFVAKAPPDGHAMVFVASTFTSLPAFMPDLPFDPIKDFAPVSQLTKRSVLLVVTPSFPARNFQDYLAYAKINPAKINMGTTGVGGSFHMVGAMFVNAADIKVTFIHYKGSAQNFVDLAAGRLHSSPMTVYAALPQLKAGKVRAIGYLSAQRSPWLPDLPTVAEQIQPGFDYTSWAALFATGGTPRDVIAKLSKPIMTYARSAEGIAKASAQGDELVGSTPEELAALVAREVPRWKKVVKDNDIKPEE